MYCVEGKWRNASPILHLLVRVSLTLTAWGRSPFGSHPILLLSPLRRWRKSGARRSVGAARGSAAFVEIKFGAARGCRKMLDAVYTEHLKGRKVLLETPTGFAVFIVNDFVFKEDKNIWVHFSDPECAIQALFALGFKRLNKSAARKDNASPAADDLVQLIMKFCRAGEALIVQDKELKASIEKNIRIKCRCDGYDVGEVIWGIKNVLHAFIAEEKPHITKEYCFPVSKGLEEALQYYLVTVPPELVGKPFISKFGFLCYLDMNLEGFPKELRRSFDKYVGIGDTIEDGLDYVKLVALVLVPELVKEHDFSKTLSSDLQSKLEKAKKFQADRNDDLTMHDVEKIMGYLKYLLDGSQQRDNIIIDVKLMEDALHRSINGVKRVKNPWEPENFNNMEYRRVLLETPSGFAMFIVWEIVFCNDPEDIWTYFADIHDARKLVFGIGFVSVDDKSVARNSVKGPGDELRQLILRFCNAEKELVVQDTQLKAVIETKLGVKCRTGDRVVEEVIWGLNYVMPQFVLKERNKITDNYFHPLSKQILHDLETYGIVSTATSQITTDIIEVFGYVKFLDTIFEETSKDLHAKCNCYVSDIIIGEDDMTNANMITKVAKVLVPEFKEEIVVPQFKEDIGLPKIAGGLGSKPMSLAKDAVKAIADCDKQEILKSLEMLSYICRQKKRAFQKLREIEAQIGVARIAASDEAVDKDGNKDGGFVKFEPIRSTNSVETKPMENGGSSNKGKTKPMEHGGSSNKGMTKPMEHGGSSNKGKTKAMEKGEFSNKGKRVNKGKTNKHRTRICGPSPKNV